MNDKQLRNNQLSIGGLLLICGGVAAFYGISIQNTPNYRFVTAFGGDTKQITTLIIVGIIAAIAGIILLILGASGTSEKPRSTTTHESEAPLAQTQEYSEEQLHEIISNSSLYRPEVIEACTKELSIRTKSAEIMPQMQDKSDDELRQITDNSQIYTDELLRCAKVILSERQLQWQQEQREQREQHRQEQIKQAQEQEQLRQQEWQRKKPKIIRSAIFGLIAIIIIVTAGYLFSNPRQYRRGENLFNKGNSEQAIRALNRIGESSKHYSAAQLLIFQACMNLQDSVGAAKALCQSVSKGNWDHSGAYLTYTGCCISGILAPYLPKDEIAAASLYEKHPSDAQVRLKAAMIYFQNGSYDRAHKILSAEDDQQYYGYLGIIHLYGLGSADADPKLALNYLKDAPDAQPFAVYKGDLALFLRKNNNDYSAIRKANQHYQSAQISDPNNKDIELRLKVTNQLITAQDQHEKRQSENWSDDKWAHYNFDNGQYDGESIGRNDSDGSYLTLAQGWGCFTWETGDIRMGYFSSGISAGLGMNITDGYQITIGTLSGNMGHVTSGILISPDGTIQEGTFDKNQNLIKGIVRSLNGHIISQQ